MAKIFLVAPDAPMEDVAQLKPDRRLGTGALRLGVLDNSKGNADHLLNLIVEGVKKEFRVDSVVVKRKPTSSRPSSGQSPGSATLHRAVWVTGSQARRNEPWPLKSGR